MLAGLNFVGVGLPSPQADISESPPTNANVLEFKALALRLLQPWRWAWKDWSYCQYVLADPAAYLLQPLAKR
jgi:hypothetical protein